MKKTSPLKR